MLNFFFNPDAVTPGRLIMLAILVLVILACVLPGKIKKHKLSKLENENPQAKQDWDKMSLHICPFCGEKYVMVDKKVSVMDRPNRLISGTFYSAEYSDRYHKELICSKCNYVIRIEHHHSVTRDEACRETVEDTYHWSLKESAHLDAEQKERVTSALSYKSKKELLEKG